MEYIFRRAQQQDVDSIMTIIKDRIDWMAEKKIHQWGQEYLEMYPKEYFCDHAKKGQLYVAQTLDGEIVGAIVMMPQDPYWSEDLGKNCYYLHHLATKQKAHGAGTGLMAYCEEIARQEGKESMRLDCQKGNEYLNKLYEGMGYEYVCTMVDGGYEGIKREKTFR